MNNLTTLKKIPENRVLELKVNSGTSIRLYPNPTASFMLIEAPEKELINLALTSIDGKDLSEEISINRVTPIKYIINVSSLDEGIYILKTPSNTRVIYKRRRMI
ncbi:MAG TPA: T9SS type A sorting domain-containing protein [Parasegetibacter sp.]|jgi:hypothetical protein